MQIYRVGDEGPEILDIQHRLIELGFTLPEDETGAYGEETREAVRAFQTQRSLRADGIVGPDTWGQLIEAGFRLGDRTLYLHAPFQRGDDVRALQRKLDALGFDPGKQDGVYGPTTDAALREFQRNVGDEADGVVGLHTIATLERMRPLDDAPSRGVVRETEQLRAIRGRLDGHVIAIDPGERESGPADRSIVLARAVAVELARLGAKPEILSDGTSSTRAAMANTVDAAACVSLHLVEGVPESSGPTCSYFGSQATYSPAGQHLAELILEELEHELRLRGRVERLTVSMLRETRMPAVQVEALVAASEVGSALPRTPDATSRIGRAIGEGVRRFFED